MRAGGQTGFVTVTTAFDGLERIYAYRKLPRHDIYVVTGLSTQDVRLAWLDDMSRHLIFGIPATAAMIGLSLMALGRTRRESVAIPATARRDRAARSDRGSAAPGAEDGGGRPAHRRHRARLQQPAHAIMGNLDLALRRLDGGSAFAAGSAIARLAPTVPPRWCSACLPSRASIRSR